MPDWLSSTPRGGKAYAEQPAFTAPVTILVGENGVGKSTLIEAVAVGMGFNAEGGTRNFSFATQETHSALYRYVEFVRGPYRPRDGFFLRAESFYNVASYVDEIGDQKFLRRYGGKSLHDQSHGACLLQIDEDGIRPTEYHKTSHYQITRRFLENPDRMYRELFREG